MMFSLKSALLPEISNSDLAVVSNYARFLNPNSIEGGGGGQDNLIKEISGFILFWS